MTTATSIQTKLYIDGKWCDALDGKTHAVINPATASFALTSGSESGKTMKGACPPSSMLILFT